MAGEHIPLRCSIDIEQTAASFHAHAIPENVEIHAGDVVMVLDAPYEILFGEHVICERLGVLIRAGLLTRLWTRISSLAEISELYEVGFQPLADVQPSLSHIGA